MSNREDMLGAAIEEYLTAMDGGQPPDTNDFLARHHQIDGELRDFLENLNYIDDQFATAVAESQRAGLARTLEDSSAEPAALESDSPDPRFPQIPGFRVVGELGQGSQGIVYRAVQLGTGRVVALKVIREGLFASIRERQRFANEVQVVSRLSHPNIVAVYECGIHAGRDYYAMEYIEGRSLDVALADERGHPTNIVNQFLQVVDAVSYAHQHGVIHRDLKPTNIIVDKGGVVHVLDFGLAKRIDEAAAPSASAATRVGEFAGTLWYASPEQVRRDPNLIDVRSDVYSLGVILFELLSGKLPYPIDEQTGMLAARHILDTHPSRLRASGRHIDVDIESIVQRTLEKDPALRYQSAAQFADDLRSWLAGEPIRARPHTTWYVLGKTLRRYRWQAASVGLALTALLVFAVTVFFLNVALKQADATNIAQMGIVRDNQRYLSEKSYDSHRLANRFQELVSFERTHLVELRPAPPVAPFAWPAAWTELVGDAPRNMLTSVRGPVGEENKTARNWLTEHENELAGAARTLREHPIRVDAQQRGRENLLASLSPLLTSAVGMSELFAASAWNAWEAHDPERMLVYLEASRSIAIDLADGPLLHHKTSSVNARSVLYGLLLHLLDRSSRDHPPDDRLLRWILIDPPLVEYRHAFTDERQRRVQVCEDVTIGKPGDTTGLLDVDGLRKLLGPMYQQALPSMVVHSDQLIELIDFHVTQVETWDGLTFADLTRERGRLRERLHQSPAWELVKPLFPDYGEAFAYRGRVCSLREATRIAACMLLFLKEHDRWPTSIQESLAADSDAPRRGGHDPYIGVPFGMNTGDDGRPVIYSVGEDGVDDGGRSGEWNEPGRDMVFFPTRDTH